MDDYDFEDPIINFKSAIKANKTVMAYQHLKEIIVNKLVLSSDDLNSLIELFY